MAFNQETHGNGAYNRESNRLPRIITPVVKVLGNSDLSTRIHGHKAKLESFFLIFNSKASPDSGLNTCVYNNVK